MPARQPTHERNPSAPQAAEAAQGPHAAEIVRVAARIRTGSKAGGKGAADYMYITDACLLQRCAALPAGCMALTIHSQPSDGHFNRSEAEVYILLM